MKWLNKKIKNFGVWDIVLLLITVFFLALLIAMLRPELIDGKYSMMWLGLFVIAAAKPFYVLFLRK